MNKSIRKWSVVRPDTGGFHVEAHEVECRNEHGTFVGSVTRNADGTWIAFDHASEVLGLSFPNLDDAKAAVVAAFNAITTAQET